MATSDSNKKPRVIILGGEHILLHMIAYSGSDKQNN